MNIRVTKYKWDKGLDYFDLKNRLLNAYDLSLSIYLQKKGRRMQIGNEEIRRSSRSAKQLIYVATGLLQLANGLRNGEALISFRQFIEKGVHKFYILVFKQKLFKRDPKTGKIIKKKENELRDRLVVVPYRLRADYSRLNDAFYSAFKDPDEFIPQKFFDPFERNKNEKAKKEYRKYEAKYSKWWITNFDINPHTFRYAWQNYVLNKIPVELTAKIQGRANLSVLLEYLRHTESEKYLESVIDF